MSKALYDRWMSTHVKVTKGPFAGKDGQVTGVGDNRLEVAFSPSVLQKDRLWFHVSQLEQQK